MTGSVVRLKAGDTNLASDHDRSTRAASLLPWPNRPTAGDGGDLLRDRAVGRVLPARRLDPLPDWRIGRGPRPRTPIVVCSCGCLCRGAVAGDQLGFALGRRFGPRLFARPDSRFFRREHADRATEFFRRRGGAAVILARFVPVVRTFVPGVAGVARMPYRRFTAFNLAGAALWAVGLVMVGYNFGGIPFVAQHIELITIALAALSVIPVGIELVRRRRRQATHTSSPEREDALEAPPLVPTAL